MPSSGEQQKPRCLLCAMHCPMGARTDRFGYVRSVFPGDLGAEGGACVRGVTAARLMAAENRVFTGRVDGASVDLSHAVQALVGAFRNAGHERIAIVVDANRPLEGLAAVAALRNSTGSRARVCAFVPPQDVPLVTAGIGPLPPFDHLDACDVVVTIGDVCSTHPAIAWRLRAMQRAGRGRRWISIDTAPGRSSRAADNSVFVSPHEVAQIVASLAQNGSAADAEVAHALRLAERPGLVVSCSPGRFAAPADVLSAARDLAAARGAHFWALPSCTNALAVPALKQELGLQDMADVLQAIESGQVEALLVVGLDPSSALPAATWQHWTASCRTVAWAGSLDCRFADSADVVIPLALPWEESGTVMDAQGVPQDVPAWQDPPPGVPSVVELAAALAEEAAVPMPSLPSLDSIGATSRGAAPGPQTAITEPLEGQAILVGAPEPHSYTGGLSLADGRWQLREASAERALCSAAAWPAGDVTREGIIAIGEGPGAAVAAVVAERDGWHAPVVAMPDHWPALRDLLRWSVTAAGLQAEPASVPIRKGD